MERYKVEITKEALIEELCFMTLSKKNKILVDRCPKKG